MAETEKKERCWICNTMRPKDIVEGHRLYIHTSEGQKTAYNHAFQACKHCNPERFTHLMAVGSYYALCSGKTACSILWTDMLLMGARIK